MTPDDHKPGRLRIGPHCRGWLGGLRLEQARKHDPAVVIQLEGENWWGARPDLWNWREAARPGCSSTNRDEVLMAVNEGMRTLNKP